MARAIAISALPPAVRLSRARCASDKDKLQVPAAASVAELKTAILRSVSNTNRGKEASNEQKQKILELVEELERTNPTEKPVNSDLLSGTWALLYTAPLNEESVDKFAGTEEGPFLSRIKPLAFGTIKQTRSLQIIDANNGSVKNIADFSFMGINGSLCINGTAVKSLEPGTEGVRLLVTFESFVLVINRIQVVTISLAFIKPKGWVDTTYLDDGMRVGRGDKGSIFVAVRTKMVS